MKFSAELNYGNLQPLKIPCQTYECGKNSKLCCLKFQPLLCLSSFYTSLKLVMKYGPFYSLAKNEVYERIIIIH